MPATLEAAATTDVYRSRLLAQREVTAQRVAAGIAGVDLDLARAPLTMALRQWADAAATTVELGQLAAVDLTASYLAAYLNAAAVPIDPLARVDVRRHIGLVPEDIDGDTIDAALQRAGHGLLWRLGRGAGRAQSVRYGQSMALRTSRTAVTDSAHHAMADLFAEHPRITGWRRVTSLNTCNRCAQAAKRIYRKSDLLPRHPSCRCTREAVIDWSEPFTRAEPTVARP